MGEDDPITKNQAGPTSADTPRSPSRRPTAAPASRSSSRSSSSSRALIPSRSSAYPESVQRLIDELAKLPGVGRRSAERLAFHVLKASRNEALALARAIDDVKMNVRHCAICFNLADAGGVDGEDDDDNPPAAAVQTATTAAPPRAHAENAEGPGGSRQALCAICASPSRDGTVVMVVEQPKDLIALEQTGMYKGVYHVLMGRISPLDGVGPGDVTIADLLRRVDHPERNAGAVRIREVILALNPTLEADGTALYIAERLADRGVKVSRLARGLPTGTTIEFANKAVLADAIEGRQAMG